MASNTDDDLVAEPNRRITRTHDGVLIVVHSDDPSGIEIGDSDGDIARGVLVHRDDDVRDDDASSSSSSSPSSWRLGHTDPNVVDVELETTRERCDDDDDDATRSDDV